MSQYIAVAPREGRVSRNTWNGEQMGTVPDGRAPRGACE